MASCESGPPGALSLYQRQVLGVSSSARSLEKLASMKATRPSSPAVDRRADGADAGHQPGAMADRDGDAVAASPAPRSRARPRACWRSASRCRRACRPSATSRAIGKCCSFGTVRMTPLTPGSVSMVGEVGHHLDAEFPREGRALLLRAAMAGDDLQGIGPEAGAGQHLGPAAEPYDPNRDGSCCHQGLLLVWTEPAAA